MKRQNVIAAFKKPCKKLREIKLDSGTVRIVNHGNLKGGNFRTFAGKMFTLILSGGVLDGEYELILRSK